MVGIPSNSSLSLLLEQLLALLLHDVNQRLPHIDLKSRFLFVPSLPVQEVITPVLTTINPY